MEHMGRTGGDDEHNTCEQSVRQHGGMLGVWDTSPGTEGVQPWLQSHMASYTLSCHRHRLQWRTEGRASRGRCDMGQGTCGCHSGVCGHMAGHMGGSRPHSIVVYIDACRRPLYCYSATRTCTQQFTVLPRTFGIHRNNMAPLYRTSWAPHSFHA